MLEIQIAPSILAADFTKLGEQVREAEAAGADLIHVDVMDGHFVPNISIGVPVVKSLSAVTSRPLDVHLMIENPERYLEAFVRAGASILTVHEEACRHLHRVVQQIKSLGVKAGVALNPATPLVALEEILPYLDLVLVMSVNPGFGGQSYISSSTQKILRLKETLSKRGSHAEIEVDGGIDPRTAAEVANAGADILVAGSSIFGGAGTISSNIRALRNSVHQPTKELS